MALQHYSVADFEIINYFFNFVYIFITNEDMIECRYGDQKTGHPLVTTPGAVGHLAKGQWSSPSRPHHVGPKIS
jgi:hypothetical protein